MRQPRIHPGSTRPAERPRAASSYVDTGGGQSGVKGVFGFATRRDLATGARVVNVTRVIDIIRAVGLALVIITVSLASPRPGTDGARGLAIAIALGLSAAAWIIWL